ncbi:MAG TPA: alpha/beta fold hydrolase [Pseudonocardiaceae bacterium]|nr:alpha/beta fold hydrolase [Pseudonocardiaceae bacterium]
MTSLRLWSDPDDARMWLLCVPPSGGGVHLFRDWAGLLPAALGVAALEPPGRGTRAAEPLADDAGVLTAAFARDTESLLDRPVVVFGHSMGAIIAFDIVRELRRTRRWRPAALILAASEPPDEPLSSAEPSDERLTGWLRDWGGTATELLADPEYLAALLPVLRADLGMLARRVHRAEAPLDCPLHLYFGADDPTVDPAAAASGWARQTTAAHTTDVFPGGHFFVRQSVARVLATLVDQVDAVVGGRLPRTPTGRLARTQVSVPNPGAVYG